MIIQFWKPSLYTNLSFDSKPSHNFRNSICRSIMQDRGHFLTYIYLIFWKWTLFIYLIKKYWCKSRNVYYKLRFHVSMTEINYEPTLIFYGLSVPINILIYAFFFYLIWHYLWSIKESQGGLYFVWCWSFFRFSNFILKLLA